MVILGIILQQVIPLVLPFILETIRQGKDPATIDWQEWARHYGRSMAALEAEEDAKERP